MAYKQRYINNSGLVIPCCSSHSYPVLKAFVVLLCSCPHVLPVMQHASFSLHTHVIVNSYQHPWPTCKSLSKYWKMVDGFMTAVTFTLSPPAAKCQHLHAPCARELHMQAPSNFSNVMSVHAKEHVNSSSVNGSTCPQHWP